MSLNNVNSLIPMVTAVPITVIMPSPLMTTTTADLTRPTVSPTNMITPSALSSQTTQRTITIIFLILGILCLIGGVLIYIFYKHRKKHSKPEIPTLPFSKEYPLRSATNVSDLGVGKLDRVQQIPLIFELPPSTNNLYTVYEAYEPLREDEMELRKADVVSVNSTFADGWGYGTNLTLSVMGFFPLVCLVSDHDLRYMNEEDTKGTLGRDRGRSFDRGSLGRGSLKRSLSRHRDSPPQRIIPVRRSSTDMSLPDGLHPL